MTTSDLAVVLLHSFAAIPLTAGRQPSKAVATTSRRSCPWAEVGAVLDVLANRTPANIDLDVFPSAERLRVG